MLGESIAWMLEPERIREAAYNVIVAPVTNGTKPRSLPRRRSAGP